MSRNFQIPSGYTQRRVVEEDVNTTYVGYSELGTLTTSSAWVVMKIVTAGNVTETYYAEGVFDDYLTLNYR
jgi:hypothetical protein